MELPKGATVAVADGGKLVLFRNNGEGNELKLTALPKPEISADDHPTRTHHHSSSANPDESQLAEDDFAAGIVEHLNRQAIAGTLHDLLIVAAPKTLGEMRKHYHTKLSSALIGELDKDLTGRPIPEIEKAIKAA